MEKCPCAQEYVCDLIRKRGPKRRTLKSQVLASLSPETHTGVDGNPLFRCLSFSVDWGIQQGNDKVILVPAMVLNT